MIPLLFAVACAALWTFAVAKVVQWQTRRDKE